MDVFITRHARSRIRTRTKSTAGEFKTLCEEKLYLVLGQAEYAEKRYTYVLFYLLRENKHYIGVLNKDQSVMVAVWKNGYHLPRRIPKLRRCQRRQIRCDVTDAMQFVR